ncbi:hypothetical protein FJD32_000285 [Shewanella sp. LC6]|uniref:hypothetical protein n=1 Tax=unclassified Shewanella TaxID=196818 RepID=UPI000B51DC2F|nr:MULTISPECIES: hypothetical protein [unclassified Shewanella]ASF16102.1 hypothetical protein CEQ32_14600 [Shewanella sp. FDAARGOS_354]QQK58065.1 hypothetical protein FJD32_000285 [Shewanella sp. LC6]TPE46881.1 hypothetical protein FJD33_24755 [Shewanella sp. LC2]
MSIDKSVALGIAGNELSKQITNSSEVSLGRTLVATGSGAALGAATAGVLTVGAAAAGVATAPVTVPLAVAAGLVSFIASRFD